MGNSLCNFSKENERMNKDLNTVNIFLFKINE